MGYVVSRRAALVNACALAFVGMHARVGYAAPNADSTTTLNSVKRVDALEDTARRLGIPTVADTETLDAGAESLATDDYNGLITRLLEMADGADELYAKESDRDDDTLSGPSAKTAETRDFTLRVDGALRDLSSKENDTRARKPSGVRRVSNARAAEYRRLFSTMQIQRSPAYVRRRARAIATGPRREIYEKVAALTLVPWYLIGIMHSLEANINIRCHLHNGDSLFKPTRQVPKERPSKQWSVPIDASLDIIHAKWIESAQDALAFDRMTWKEGGKTTTLDWTVEEMLYRAELFNGPGYRNRGISAPYVWSYSNHYIKGYYVADHRFDPEKVAQIMGAAVILKQMIDDGHIQQPPFATA